VTDSHRPPLAWVALDVGETLIDETRVWGLWADVLGVPRLTLGAALGAVIADGRHFRSLFEVLGVDDWQSRADEVEQRFGGFQPIDLYPDALPAMADLRDRGLRLAVVANQPARRTAELRAIGVEADVIAMSDEIGVGKPDPRFYGETLRLLGEPDPATVAYVGDRVDNDVLPAREAGLRAVWLRRGPWGRIQSLPAPDAVDLVVDSLAELVARIDEV
jgi:HAD superfamily hydrolase (TIGR01549 family)